MKKELIVSYIKNITKNDIESYLSKECVCASKSEIDVIYNAIKNDYEEILGNNFMHYITNYELILNRNLYLKIIEKYNQYKSLLT